MQMGLKPREFWRLLPCEFDDILAGYHARQDEEWRRTAWLAHYVLATAMGNKAPTPDELLGHVVDGTKYEEDEDGDEPSEPPPV